MFTRAQKFEITVKVISKTETHRFLTWDIFFTGYVFKEKNELKINVLDWKVFSVKNDFCTFS